MRYVNLNKLILHNFRSFYGTHEINLGANGLVLISAINQDSKGGSGAGKSNFLNAISYLFRFCPYTAKDNQNWDTEDDMYVEGYMDTHEGPVIIRRGDKLSLTVNGVENTGSAKAVEEAIDRLCGIPKELREVLIWRGQDEKGKILTMDDGELKEFLTAVLELDWLEKEIDIRSKELGGIEKDFKVQEQQLELYEKDLKPTPILPYVVTCKAGIKNKIIETENEASLAELLLKTTIIQHNEAEKAQKQLIQQFQLDVQPKLDDLDTQIVALKTESIAKMPIIDNTEINALQEKVRVCHSDMKYTLQHDQGLRSVHEGNLQAMYTTLVSLEKKRKAIKANEVELDRVKKQIDKLKENKCPTCDREWLTQQAKLAELHDYLAEITQGIEQAEELDVSLASIKKTIQSYPAFEPNPILNQFKLAIDKLQTAIAVAEEKQAGVVKGWEAKIQAQVVALESKKKSLQMEVQSRGLDIIQAEDSQLVNLTKKIMDLNSVQVGLASKLQGLKNELGLTQERDRSNKAIYDSYLDSMKKYEAVLKELHNKVDVLTTKLNAESDYLEMLKGFLSNIFGEILAEIGDTASEILEGLPNTTHMEVQFKPDKVTAKGVIKSTITPVLKINGTERPLKSGSSGGQSTSINLAVDLAVNKVVSRRLGASMNFMVLDEAFNGHEAITKEACLSILRTHAGNKMILVVDHSNEFKEHFSNVINVRFENGRSSIR